MIGTGILGMLGPQPGISNTLDLGGDQKIQDYLAGAGTSTTGPGGGTLYTGGDDVFLPTVSKVPGPGLSPDKLPFVPRGGFEQYPGGTPIISNGIVNMPTPVPFRPGGPVIDPGRDPNFMGRPVMPRPGPGFPGIGGGIGGINQPQPVNPLPSPGQPDFGQFKDDLLSGIGDLFKQYFDQQQDTPSINEPFDIQGINPSPSKPSPLGLLDQNNFAQNDITSQQVFGSMLTPFGRQQ
jgi:hypothetical protein